MAKKILSIILNIILVFLLFVGLLILFSLLPIRNNIKILSVMSGSMEPTIKTGSLIFIKPIDSYKVNDIVTFKTPSGKNDKDYTTHRIYKVEMSNQAEVYTTTGDANSTPDGWVVYRNDIIGKHYVTIPYAGYLITYVKTLPGLILLILIPATIIVYEESKKVHREAKLILKKRRAKKTSKKSESDSLNKVPTKQSLSESQPESVRFKKEERKKDDAKTK